MQELFLFVFLVHANIVDDEFAAAFLSTRGFSGQLEGDDHLFIDFGNAVAPVRLTNEAAVNIETVDLLCPFQAVGVEGGVAVGELRADGGEVLGGVTHSEVGRIFHAGNMDSGLHTGRTARF